MRTKLVWTNAHADSNAKVKKVISNLELNFEKPDSEIIFRAFLAKYLAKTKLLNIYAYFSVLYFFENTNG